MDDFTIAKPEEIAQAEKEKNNKYYMKVRAPFGYFGAKNIIASKICRDLPAHYCWVEAYAGSAALTLSKPPVQIEVINDVDGEIVNVFEQLRNNQKELCRLIALTPYARQELEKARVTNKNDNDLERARKFLVQAMFAINGVFGKEKGGFSYSHSYSRNGRDARVNRWYNLPARLEKVAERLRNLRIENRDALEVFEMFLNRPATLIYLDPPYLGKRTAGYTNDANNEEYHLKMLKMANRAKCMVLISGYKNKLYNEYLNDKNGWKSKMIPTITKDSKGHSYERFEVIWTNKHYQEALITGKIPIRLTEKEKKYNKLNPER